MKEFGIEGRYHDTCGHTITVDHFLSQLAQSLFLRTNDVSPDRLILLGCPFDRQENLNQQCLKRKRNG